MYYSRYHSCQTSFAAGTKANGSYLWCQACTALMRLPVQWSEVALMKSRFGHLQHLLETWRLDGSILGPPTCTFVINLVRPLKGRDKPISRVTVSTLLMKPVWINSGGVGICRRNKVFRCRRWQRTFVSYKKQNEARTTEKPGELMFSGVM